MVTRTSSFTEFLASYAPELLRGGLMDEDLVAGGGTGLELAHGTTIVAATFAGGVVLAGGRRATMASMISKREVRKVFRTDEHSAVGVAGAWSIAVELVRLFQVELEHYEKMEGRQLSLTGKANRLAAMIRGNLGAVMQGLAVMPLFAGYDEEARTAWIYSYDLAGGPSEEHRFHAIGSGSIFARGSLKKLYADNMPARDAMLACAHALYDAADDDSATGGPDLTRQIFPVIATVTADGFAWMSDGESEEYARMVVEERLRSPDGPKASPSAARRLPGQAGLGVVTLGDHIAPVDSAEVDRHALAIS
ncbi:MAG: proteasome subunit beta [Streptosporangiaceae bacterium]|nr:proteasome subunit beta [Streptosporangiaceae bacterium]MBV9857528.1 proteasome subunit beta [Streptosporangiaceae bacterium]